MEEALIARARASTAIAEVAGSHNGRPAIDLHERKSNEKSAFPAAVVTISSPGKSYSQDGPDRLQQRLIRFECFGLSAYDTILLKRAIVETFEKRELVDGVQFSPAQPRFERSFPPEDVASLRIFRTLVDLIIPSNR